MKKFFLYLALSSLIFSCKESDNVVPEPDSIPIAPPQWIRQGSIYEVNVRQYTPEGTFNAFVKHLDRLKDMGVQTVWFMPINPISKVGRKGALGSYYAVSDYKAINPEFGTINDWKQLVRTLHGQTLHKYEEA